LRLSVWLVVNPRAGGGRGSKVVDGLVPLLRRQGIDPIVRICANGNQPAQIARRATAEGADLVVAIGGDGHAAAVAEGVLGSDATLAVMPAGSANDYARVLGVRRFDLDWQARLLARRPTRRVDVIRVEMGDSVRHVLSVSGTGFDAQVAERAMRITWLHGAPRYVMAMLAELPSFTGGRFIITVDGVRREQAAMLVAVAKSSTYGGGMRVAPQADLFSGRLEVCIVGQLSRLNFLRAFPSVFRGTHVNHPAVTMLRAMEVSIEADRAFGVLGDGELLGRLPATFRVEPAALSVVSPLQPVRN
jgi:diacylglycerol kinase (ATP)